MCFINAFVVEKTKFRIYICTFVPGYVFLQLVTVYSKRYRLANFIYQLKTDNTFSKAVLCDKNTIILKTKNGLFLITLLHNNRHISCSKHIALPGQRGYLLLFVGFSHPDLHVKRPPNLPQIAQGQHASESS